jgi:hypothetical protein
MAEHVGDLLQAGAPVDHAGSGGVAEHVCPGQVPERDACTNEIAPHDRGDRRSLEGPRWIGEGEEHPTFRMVRSGVAEILGQRSADLLGQRQHPLAATLPDAKAELSCMPIQVVQFERGDLAGAQAQTGQQREDRPVTIRHRTRCGRTLQQSRKLLRGEVRRQASMPRMPDPRDGAVEPTRSNTAPSEESQEGARGARRCRAPVLCLVCGLPPDELGHKLDGQAGPIGRIRSGTGRDESLHGGQVAQSRRIGGPNHVAQIVGVAGDPASGAVICRVHHNLPAAVLAARRGSLIMPRLR